MQRKTKDKENEVANTSKCYESIRRPTKEHGPNSVQFCLLDFRQKHLRLHLSQPQLKTLLVILKLLEILEQEKDYYRLGLNSQRELVAPQLLICSRCSTVTVGIHLTG